MGSFLCANNGMIVPETIKEQDLFDGNEDAINKFRNNFRNLGFVVLEMNDDFNALTAKYKQICGSFFESHNFNQKMKFEAEEKDELFKDLGRKPNIGYILTKNKKEYLKFKRGSDISSFPNDDIHETFKLLFDRWKKTVDTTIHTVLSETAKNERSNKIECLTEEKERDSIVKFAGKHGSISVIHYFNKLNEINSDDDKIWNRTTDIPLGKHHDTGLMTFILCSDVKGLQILDRKTQEYFHCEPLFESDKHCFVIPGRKMELFSWKKPIKPCWHQVKVDLKDSRYSTLFFVEIQKDH